MSDILEAAMIDRASNVEEMTHLFGLEEGSVDSKQRLKRAKSTEFKGLNPNTIIKHGGGSARSNRVLNGHRFSIDLAEFTGDVKEKVLHPKRQLGATLRQGTKHRSATKSRKAAADQPQLETTQLYQLILQGAAAKLFIKEKMSEIAFEGKKEKYGVISLHALTDLVNKISYKNKSPRLHKTRLKFSHEHAAELDQLLVIFDRVIRSIDYYTATNSYQTISLFLRMRSARWGKSILERDKEINTLFEEKLAAALSTLSCALKEASLKKFTLISKREFALGQKYSEKPEFAKYCPQFDDYCKTANNAVWCIVEQVLSLDTPDARSEEIEKFVLIADHCSHIGNFMLCMGILGGIEHSVISRLALTWDLVPEDIKEMKSTLVKKFDSTNNYEPLKREMNVFEGSLVPFLPPMLTHWSNLQGSKSRYLSDIQELAVQADEIKKAGGEQDKSELALIQEESNRKKLGFIRTHAELAKSIEKLLKWQDEGKKIISPRQSEPDFIQQLLNFQSPLSDSELSEAYYERSKKLEPISPTAQQM